MVRDLPVALMSLGLMAGIIGVFVSDGPNPVASMVGSILFFSGLVMWVKERRKSG